MTNRDFYKGLERLMLEQQDKPAVLLEDYLRSLRARARGLRCQPEISPETFYALLAESFSPATQTTDTVESAGAISDGFKEWDAIIEQQIKDLRSMQKNGQLEDKQRYFGIDAPSGQRWYNFDPCTYLECGAAGTLGGWEEGDETGRQYVPGKVAVLAEDGDITSCEPQELHQLPQEMSGISWALFRDFLWCGQNYE